MKRTTYKTDREMRSNQPWFASRRSAPDWPDIRVIAMRYKRGTARQQYTVSLARADEVTWLEPLTPGSNYLGLFIPAGTPILHLDQDEYAEFGFWTVE